MREARRIIRIFLASPGDLNPERLAARDAVDFFNSSLSEHFGYHIELMGWEDTLPSNGRPQAIINNDLERCELFIGMLWKRWGTPPDNEGIYSSGFEEEYELSIDRFKKTQKPNISIYFKNVDEEFLKDPGPDLIKVLKFKERLISEKQILFETFNSLEDFKEKLTKKIHKFVIALAKAEQEEVDIEKGHTKSDKEQIVPHTPNNDRSQNPLSQEGYEFLKQLLDKSEAQSEKNKISAGDIARFRLLANSVSESGNDEHSLGTHDANILFTQKTNFCFSYLEINTLLNCGLKNIYQETYPLWHWYALRKHSLIYKTLGPESICSGSLEAMRLLSLPILEDEHFNRSFFIETWLSENSSDSVKVAALNYLKYHGISEDLSFIQAEVDQGNYKTTKIAIEALLSIKLRYNKKEAFETAITIQFDSIDQNLISDIASLNIGTAETLLRQGLRHRNKDIRLVCLNQLNILHNATVEDLQGLLDDNDAEIRSIAIKMLILKGQIFSDDDTKKIILKGSSSSTLIGSGGTEKTYEEYLYEKTYALQEDVLLKKVQKGFIYDDIEYFVLCDKYFKKYANWLRHNVDNQFKDYLENQMLNWEKAFGKASADELRRKAKSVEEFQRKKLTRKGLNLLCKKGLAQDLEIIRRNLKCGFVESSTYEIEFLEKHGEWEDITYIADAKEYNSLARLSLITFSDSRVNWSSILAKAIYKIGSNRIEELLKIKMPASVTSELIKLCSINVFSQISEKTLFGFLNNENNDIRKTFAIKCVQSFNKAKLKKYLDKYISQEKYFYNVIHWLDLGVSLSKSIAKKAIYLKALN